MKKLFACASIIVTLFLQAQLASAASVVLKFGDQGTQVYQLQTFLKRTGYFTTVPTGNYYSVTEQAIKSFQNAYGLSETGIFDEETNIIVHYLFGDIFAQPIDMTSTSATSGDTVDSFDDLPLFDPRLESNS